MASSGYVIYKGNNIDLPEDWKKRALQLNLICSDGIARAKGT
jgi:hypothetical protein